MSDVGDRGYDELIAAIRDGDGYYLECPDGHGSLPPRRVCPTCGATELVEKPLPETGTVETFTETHVATPEFGDDAPYLVAIVDFGPVSITGQLRTDDSTVGQTVGIDVAERKTTGDPLLVFDPQ